jgi:adenylate cyclase
MQFKGQPKKSRPRPTPSPLDLQPVGARKRAGYLAGYGLTGLAYLLIGLWAMSGAIATGINLGTVQAMERQAQILFFRMRGKVSPPETIVILAMDQDSLARGEEYQQDPDRFAALESIQAWPWRRAAYAQVIDKLLASGARAVAVDVLLADPSSYGPEDDQQLQQVLQRYPGRVVLANQYETFGTPELGERGQIINPNPDFATDSQTLGLINFLPDPDGRVYQLPDDFIDLVIRPQGLANGLTSFAAATLKAAQENVPAPRGRTLFFYGPPVTFEQIPLWQVLDPTNWAVHRQNQTFQDKIVLIGPTASFFQDTVRTPFSETLPGIELHANTIATLMENRAIADAMPQAPMRGVVVLLGILGTGVLLFKLIKRPDLQFISALGIALGWGAISYLCFTVGSLILPTAVPIVGIVLSGISCLTTGAIGNRMEQRRLRQTLERYVAAPIVHEILTQYSDDFQALLNGRRVKAAVLFCDIRGFTNFSLQLEPERLVQQLNEYLNAMVNAILDAGGTVDKFIGDAIMAEFGSPITQGEAADAMGAIRAALGMRQALMQLHHTWEQQGKPLFFNGIGINFGEAIAGDIGSTRRREYALIGDAVNVASRIEGLTRKFWTDILITQSLYDLVKDEIEVISIGTHPLKGRGDHEVNLYSLVGLKGGDQTAYHYIHEKLRSTLAFKELREE